eukprot:1346134-Pleurochrysis_carterae.AAC.2
MIVAEGEWVAAIIRRQWVSYGTPTNHQFIGPVTKPYKAFCATKKDALEHNLQVKQNTGENRGNQLHPARPAISRLIKINVRQRRCHSRPIVGRGSGDGGGDGDDNGCRLLPWRAGMHVCEYARVLPACECAHVGECQCACERTVSSKQRAMSSESNESSGRQHAFTIC